MTIVVEAVYKNGVLTLVEPVPLKDDERVTIKIESQSEKSRIEYGLMGWKGDPEVVRRIALDPEYGVQEAP
jgi:predicted DNA-binding antitoxin AbrB/MazE fold protein